MGRWESWFQTTMKYPSIYLDGEGAHGNMLSIAFAGKVLDSDTGARMIHNATIHIRQLYQNLSVKMEELLTIVGM